MSAKTIFFLSLLVAGILLLALGGLLVKGARRLVARPPAFLSRFA